MFRNVAIVEVCGHLRIVRDADLRAPGLSPSPQGPGDCESPALRATSIEFARRASVPGRVASVMDGLLRDRNVLVMGIANEHSIAWAVAVAVLQAGGRVALSYQAPRLRQRLERLLRTLEPEQAAGVPLIECDVSDDDAVAAAMTELAATMPQLHGLVHSIAWAPAEDLQGSFASTTRAGFAAANDVAYSLVAVAREARRLFVEGSSIVTMTYAGSQRAMPNYNVMGPAKASLEACVRYLAVDLGPAGVRVNGRRPHPHRRRPHHQGLRQHAGSAATTHAAAAQRRCRRGRRRDHLLAERSGPRRDRRDPPRGRRRARCHLTARGSRGLPPCGCATRPSEGAERRQRVRPYQGTGPAGLSCGV